MTKTTSKYAQPLTPDTLEQAAREVFAVHQSGGKTRGDAIEKILQRAGNNAEQRDMIVLRAQRFQLDGLPEPPTTSLESSQPSEAGQPTPAKEKTRLRKPRLKAVASSGQSNGGKPAKVPKGSPF